MNYVIRSETQEKPFACGNGRIRIAGAWGIAWAMLICVAGCASPPGVRPMPPAAAPATIVPTEPGIFHAVSRGETLWRISRLYQISLDELASINRITDVHTIEVGQKIFIPQRLRPAARTPAVLPESPGPRDFIWPSRGTVVRYFNQQQLGAYNRGVDIKVRTDAPVCAAADGKVIFATDNMRGYRGTVIIEHGGGFATVYSYNRQLLVKSGDSVRQGQQIAVAGSCGRSNECIVHFELRKNNAPQNPLFFLP